MQFDLDEMLLGVAGGLKAELARVPAGAAGVYLKHRLARWPWRPMLRTEGLQFSRDADGFPRTWGKSIVRPGMVDVGWVHHPTAYRGRTVVAPWLKLVHFSKFHYDRLNGSKWVKWESYVDSQNEITRLLQAGGRRVFYNTSF